MVPQSLILRDKMNITLEKIVNSDGVGLITSIAHGSLGEKDPCYYVSAGGGLFTVSDDMRSVEQIEGIKDVSMVKFGHERKLYALINNQVVEVLPDGFELGDVLCEVPEILGRERTYEFNAQFFFNVWHHKYIHFILNFGMELKEMVIVGMELKNKEPKILYRETPKGCNMKATIDHDGHIYIAKWFYMAGKGVTLGTGGAPVHLQLSCGDSRGGYNIVFDEEIGTYRYPNSIKDLEIDPRGFVWMIPDSQKEGKEEHRGIFLDLCKDASFSEVRFPYEPVGRGQAQPIRMFFVDHDHLVVASQHQFEGLRLVKYKIDYKQNS